MKSKNRRKAKYLYFILFNFFIVGFANAQTVLLEQDVTADTIVPTFGKNRKNYVGSMMGLGLAIGQPTGDSMLSMRSASSPVFSFGMYYKYRVSNTYSLLLTGSYRFSRFEFEKSAGVKYNRIVNNEFLGEFVNRINLGKRGDRIGKYFELGISGDLSFNNKQKLKSNDADPNWTFKSQKMVNINLNYLNKINYSGHFRVGFDKIVIFADYRLSDLTNNKVNYQLPPLTVGLRFDMGA